MDKKIKTFRETEIENDKFHQHKNAISIYDVDINKILYLSKFLSLERTLIYLVCYKEILFVTVMVKKLDRYVQHFQK